MKVGMEAVLASGLPQNFVAVVSDKSKELGITIAVRACKPNIDKGYDVSPKPMCVKTKTCTADQHLPFLSGFIAWKQSLFGRTPGTPLPKHNCKPVQLQVSLHEILRDASHGEYKDFQLNGNFLEFSAPLTNEPLKRIVYSLDLSQREAPKIILDPVAVIDPIGVHSPMEKPAFWNESLGDFGKVANDLYPLFYQRPDNEKKPLHVAATPDNKYITSDVDILWMTVPIEFASSDTHTTYDANDHVQLSRLLQKYFDLCSKRKAEERPALIENIENFASTTGIITPYELLVEKLINEEFGKKLHHKCNLIQHGAEVNNPGEPSPLNGKVLHLFDGMPVLTESEDELIAFVLKENFLEKNYIRIHPKWNIEKWAPVIEKQISLNQSINPRVLINFRQYQQTQHHIANDKVDTVKPIVSVIYKNLVQCGMSFHQRQQVAPSFQNAHIGNTRRLVFGNVN